MNFIRKSHFWDSALLIICCLFLTPYFVASFYNVPMADDICRSCVTYNNYFSSLLEWYLEHNGRYFNAIITDFPLFYNLTFFKLNFFLFFGLFFYAVFLFTKNIFPHSSKFSRAVKSLVFVTFFFLLTPQIASVYYWFAGITAYIFPFSLYILLLHQLFGLVIKNTSKVKTKTVVFNSLLIFAIVGSHEVIMALVLMVTLAFNIYSYLHRKQLFKFSLWLTLFSILCILAVVYSPGTGHRQEKETIIALSIPELIINSFSVSIEYLKQYILLNPVFYTLSLCLFIVFSWKAKPLRNVAPQQPWMPLLLAFSSVWGTCFVFIYSLGELDVSHPSRYVDLLYYFFILFWVLFLYSLALYFNKRIAAIPNNGITQTALVTFSLLFFYLSFKSDNFFLTRMVLKENRFALFQKQWHLRKEYVTNLSCNESTIFLPKNTIIPFVLLYDDLTEDPEFWKNRCFARYVGKEGCAIIQDDDKFYDGIVAQYKLKSNSLGNGIEYYFLTEEFIKKNNLPLLYPQLLITDLASVDSSFKVNFRNEDIYVPPLNLGDEKYAVIELTSDTDLVKIKALSQEKSNWEGKITLP